jgi:hypothetical protein
MKATEKRIGSGSVIQKFRSSDIYPWDPDLYRNVTIGNTVYHGITSILNFLPLTVVGRGMPMLADGRVKLEPKPTKVFFGGKLLHSLM